MELIDFKSLKLTTEESRDMIKFLAQKRGISTKNYCRLKRKIRDVRIIRI